MFSDCGQVRSRCDCVEGAACVAGQCEQCNGAGRRLHPRGWPPPGLTAHRSRLHVPVSPRGARGWTDGSGIVENMRSHYLSHPFFQEHEEIYNDVLADIEQFYQSVCRIAKNAVRTVSCSRLRPHVALQLCIPYRVIATHGSQVPLHASREHVLQAWFPISGACSGWSSVVLWCWSFSHFLALACGWLSI